MKSSFLFFLSTFYFIFHISAQNIVVEYNQTESLSPSLAKRLTEAGALEKVLMLNNRQQNRFMIHRLYANMDSSVVLFIRREQRDGSDLQNSEATHLAFLLAGDSCISTFQHDKRGAYFVDEVMSSSDWIIDHTSLDTILGQRVIKANHKARDAEAWFAPSIPISHGPAGFSGLPGLILKLEINEGTTPDAYIATVINTTETPVNENWPKLKTRMPFEERSSYVQEFFNEFTY